MASSVTAALAQGSGVVPPGDPRLARTRNEVIEPNQLWQFRGNPGAVAVALAGTRVPMGLLARGTGNLLARNLDVPFGEVAESFRVACTGRNRAIDVAAASAGVWTVASAVTTFLSRGSMSSAWCSIVVTVAVPSSVECVTGSVR